MNARSGRSPPPHLVIIINIILLEVEKRRGKSGRAVDLPRRKSALTYVTSPRLAGTRSRDPHEIRVGPPNPLGTRTHRPSITSQFHSFFSIFQIYIILFLLFYYNLYIIQFKFFKL